MLNFVFFWSILANLHTCNSHPNRVSYYRQNLDELIIDGFGHSNGFACIDAHGFENLYSLSFDKIELTIFQKKLLETYISEKGIRYSYWLFDILKSICSD